ncbi:MAG: hypothetical protein AB9858_05590 [Acidaminococcaceae bacterium]
MELTKLDYEILSFINKFEEIEENNIFTNFPEVKYSTSYRLRQLSIRKVNYPDMRPYSFIDYKTNNQADKIVYITNMGRKVLQDFILKENLEELRHKETVALAKRANHLSMSAIIISIICAILSLYKL